MPTAYLTSRLATTPRLFRTVNSTPADLGTVPTGGTVQTYLTTNSTNTNFGLDYDGALYVVAGSDIRRSIDDGVTWSIVLSGLTLTANWSNQTGLYVCHKDGVGRLVYAWIASSVINYAWSTTGLPGSWTSVNTGVAATTFQSCPMVYRSSLMWKNSGGAIYQLDVFSSTLTAITAFTGTASNNSYLFVWDDVPYEIARANTPTTNLVSLAGGVSTLALQVTTASQALSYAAFPDPTTNDLIFIYSTGSAMVAVSITTAFTPTTRTSTMLTGGTLASFTGGSVKVAGVYFDTEGNLGAAPGIYLLVASAQTAGTAVAMFKYNGTGTLMGAGGGTPNDSAGDINQCWVDKNLGGERFFTARVANTAGVPEAVITGNGAVVIGKHRTKFKASYPRSQTLTTIGGVAATYDLAGVALASVPIRGRCTTIKGTIGGIVHTASDLAASGTLAGPSTTIAAGSNGVNVNTFAGAGTLNVVNTTTSPVPEFPTAGTLAVATASGIQKVTYTGKTATTFTGCTSAGAGVMSTGGAVVGGLLPSGGTVNLTNGAMTGVTGTLDAATTVEALSIGGTGDLKIYRTGSMTEYPGNTTPAPLSNPSNGSITGGDTNAAVPADGTECQVSIGMSGFTAGDRFNLLPTLS